ncbi:MAG TPA: hypothetical protein VGQ00_03100 [Candidatus Norongarragalinales archaeon]|jgi:Zn-dependent protease|nr:hypothetical protein [Candidatus Norongarragalinales archaeon]
MDRTEIIHIIISAVTISLAFTLFPFSEFSFAKFALILVTVGTGFILHELAHKYTAIRYGAKAGFRAWTTGLVLALLLAFATDGRFVFAAPGATYIFGKVLNKRESGIVSLAGPMVNLVLAMLFIAVFFLAPGLQLGSVPIGLTGAYVNIFLGLFNMIPIFPLDGQKVRSWDGKIWGAMFGLLALLFIGFIFL